MYFREPTHPSKMERAKQWDGHHMSFLSDSTDSDDAYNSTEPIVKQTIIKKVKNTIKN
jgi:hypothetical protein